MELAWGSLTGRAIARAAGATGCLASSMRVSEDALTLRMEGGRGGMVGAVVVMVVVVGSVGR